MLYTVVETLRTPREEEADEDRQVREAFRQEIGEFSVLLTVFLSSFSCAGCMILLF